MITLIRDDKVIRRHISHVKKVFQPETSDEPSCSSGSPNEIEQHATLEIEEGELEPVKKCYRRDICRIIIIKGRTTQTEKKGGIVETCKKRGCVMMIHMGIVSTVNVICNLEELLRIIGIV
ncbi:hypothetical protein NQ314_001575 [Rhamnusium bicolor]|uniref:Uncharacterized protein n=1 Tax=Rhamnusium bicolor TaxID=1586634 RepID=A0AAV8ZUR9_9CUCU|nr:hypothetical protein NQ314_001575 [Rhamnusium bicolor]